MKNEYKILKKLYLIGLLCISLLTSDFIFGQQTTVSLSQRISHYEQIYTTGTAGAFDQGSYQMGMYANNSSTKQVVCWRKFRINGNDNTSSYRSLQVGDEFRISLSANTVVGEMGFALLSNPSSTNSWDDRLSNASVSVRLSNYGNWYVTYYNGTVNTATSTGSIDIGGANSYKNFDFTCLLTAPNRMNITITDGSNTSHLYDVFLNNSNPITDLSLFLEDDWNGTSHQNIYWNNNPSAPSDYIKNTNLITIGSSNGSFTINDVLSDGLQANTTSVLSINSLTKTGTGTLTLTGANTYSGPTIINGGVLQLNRTGGTTIPTTNKITVESGATLRISSNQELDELIINSGGVVIVDAGVVLKVGTTLTNNGNIIFKSSNLGTAVFDQFSGTILGSGTATVERYIPAKRGWRLLTAPVKGNSSNSIFYNWQNNGAATDNLTGVTLWNPAGTATPTSSNNGLFQGPQANIYSYSNGWSAVTNTNTTNLMEASANNAFLVFATGPHDTNTISGSTTPLASTLTPKGDLITGTVTKTLAANQFNLIGNPYASAINPVSLIATNTGVNAKIWMIDPTTGYGSYAAYDGSNWVPSTPTGGDAYIQSGQGFFVRTTGTSFTINETHKVTGNSNTWFARTNATATQTNDSDKIRVMLYKQDNNQWQLADGILAVNSDTGNNDVDATDTPKISNFNESLMFRNATSNLSIEYRALPQAGTVQAMRLTSTTVQPYELRLFTENYSNSNLQPFLEDTTTGTFTAIPTDGTIVTVPFTGVAATSTNPDQRFRIVYQSALNNADFTTILASIYPNPVTQGLLNIRLNSNEGDARFEINNLLGQVVHQGTLENIQNTVSLPILNEGIYLVTIKQSNKQFTTKIYIK